MTDDPESVPDQVAGALARIASHTTSVKKVGKALTLLRQLLTDNKLKPQHGPLCFEVRRPCTVAFPSTHVAPGAAPQHARHSQQR